MRIDANRLRGFLDCMHDEADERDKVSVRIREIVKAAKDAGFDTKAVRKVFVRERMDQSERAKQDDLLETYEASLGPKGSALRAIEAGAPVGQAAKDNNVHRATLARSRHVAKQASNATPAHDADEVITETAELESPPGEGSVRAGNEAASGASLANPSCGQPTATVSEVDATETVAAPSPQDTDTTACGGEGSASIFSVTGSSGTSPKSEREPDLQDPLTLPPALAEKRREIEAARRVRPAA